MVALSKNIRGRARNRKRSVRPVSPEALQQAVTDLRTKAALAIEELAQAMGLAREGDETMESNPLGSGMCFHEMTEIVEGLSDEMLALARMGNALGKYLAREEAR